MPALVPLKQVAAKMPALVPLKKAARKTPNLVKIKGAAPAAAVDANGDASVSDDLPALVPVAAAKARTFGDLVRAKAANIEESSDSSPFMSIFELYYDVYGGKEELKSGAVLLAPTRHAFTARDAAMLRSKDDAGESIRRAVATYIIVPPAGQKPKITFDVNRERKLRTAGGKQVTLVKNKSQDGGGILLKDTANPKLHKAVKHAKNSSIYVLAHSNKL